MKEIRRVLLFAGMTIAAVVGQAQAAVVVSVFDNIMGNSYVNAGSVINGTFNLNAALPQNSSYKKPYSILSAVLSFFFTDNNDSMGYYSNPQNSYWSGNDYITNYSQNCVNPPESASVSVQGGQSASVSTPYFSNTVYDHGYQNPIGSYQYVCTGRYWQSNYVWVPHLVWVPNMVWVSNWHWVSNMVWVGGWFSGHYEDHGYYYDYGGYVDQGHNVDQGGYVDQGHYVDQYSYVYVQTGTEYDNYYTNNSGYTGAADSVFSLNDAGLQYLSENGTLPFAITGTGGDLNFTQGRLDVTFGVTPSPVPEPSSMILMGMGLLGLLGFGKRKLITK